MCFRASRGCRVCGGLLCPLRASNCFGIARAAHGSCCPARGRQCCSVLLASVCFSTSVRVALRCLRQGCRCGRRVMYYRTGCVRTGCGRGRCEATSAASGARTQAAAGVRPAASHPCPRDRLLGISCSAASARYAGPSRCCRVAHAMQPLRML